MPTAYEKTTFKLIANFGKSHYFDKAHSEVVPPAGYLEKVPDLWAGDEFQLVLDCYEFYSATENEATKSEFGESATCSLYLREAGNADTGTLLCTGTVAQIAAAGRYCRLTFDVPKATVPEALRGLSCELYARVLGADGLTQRTAAQALTVLPAVAAGAPVSTETLAMAVYTLSTSQTLTAKRGPVRYLLNAAANAVAAALPAANAYADGQEIIVQAINITYAATVTGTINGSAGTVTFYNLRDTAVFQSDGTSWRNLNFNVGLG